MRLLAGDRLRRRVERGLDRVVHPLLPGLAAGGTAAGADRAGEMEQTQEQRQ
jgi:hypothetical protein